MKIQKDLEANGKKSLLSLSCLSCQLRRNFYMTFRKKYIEQNLKKRKGGCKKCGCCGYAHNHRIGRFLIVCRYWDQKTGLCTVWEEKGFDALPYICKVYPFDEKDTCKYIDCGYFWEK